MFVMLHVLISGGDKSELTVLVRSQLILTKK